MIINKICSNQLCTGLFYLYSLCTISLSTNGLEEMLIKQKAHNDVARSRNLGILRKEVGQHFCYTLDSYPGTQFKFLIDPSFAPEYETSSSDFMIDRFVTEIMNQGLICF